MLNMNSPHVVLGGSACEWMKEWTLVGKLHIHKHAIGRSENTDWSHVYKNSWDQFLRTDPDCVSVKRMYDLYIKKN